MWFKNLVFYRFTRPFELSAEALEQQLAEQTFTPCRSQELSRYGWAAPMTKLSEQLVHSANGSLLICAQKEEKILPASVVKDQLSEKVEQIETEQDRKVRKKERDELKDEVIMTLLPKAFSRFQRTLAYIDPKLGLLVVDASSAKRAEELCSHLRHTLGSLPVSIPALNNAPASIMTSWLDKDEALPGGLELGEEAELKDPSENGAILRCKQQDLLGVEIEPHLKAGKQAVKLALGWRDQTSFVLGEDLILRRLKFADALLDQAADMGAEDAAARFDADFYLLTETLGKLLPELLDSLGGENQDAYQSAIASSSTETTAAAAL
ncbi:recombination-associated protein RdgC [Motiliproteus sp.]|uniref:recombination-associated protein RdgC n=1 Tax=Motiliproteus sp. TaxID=1898955 RepID=UPI003BAA8878